MDYRSDPAVAPAGPTPAARRVVDELDRRAWLEHDGGPLGQPINDETAALVAAIVDEAAGLPGLLDALREADAGLTFAIGVIQERGGCNCSRLSGHGPEGFVCSPHKALAAVRAIAAARPSARFPRDITIGQKYDPGMKITDQIEADAYFEKCVEHTMSCFGKTRAEAEKIERANLGYFAGYYDNETRARVERLFHCAHPIFGAIAENGPPTADQALQAGLDVAGKARP